MKPLKTFVVSMLFILGTVSITQNARAQSLLGLSCYCDQDVSGCWHDGNSGQKCSSKKECSGGKCKPKETLLELSL